MDINDKDDAEKTPQFRQQGTRPAQGIAVEMTGVCWCGGRLGPSVHPLYVRCLECGTLVLARRLTPEQLKKFYTADGYWRGHVVQVSKHPPIDERAERDFSDRIPVWHRLLAKYKPDAQSLLEIGCAHGGFLHYCRERGVTDVVGVEVDEATCDFARKRFGLPHVASGLFPAVDLPRQQFDVIAGFDVLEHFLDPVEALRAVARLLKEDGIFIFQTPCYRGEGRDWEQFRPEEHVYLFDEQNVRRLFDAAELEPVDILPGLFPDDMFVIGRRWKKAERLLFVRTDAIGDNLLAASMLAPIHEKYPQAQITVVCQEHIAELYETCPYVADVVPFNRVRAYQDEPYRDSLLERLRAVRADIALNTVYSREPLTDFLTLGSGAARTVAHRGDAHNMPVSMLAQHNAMYHVLASSPGHRKPELDRHADFLRALGITAVPRQPRLWLSAEDKAFAEEFFLKHRLDPARTIMLFAGAQAPARVYPYYVQALAEICHERDFTVVTVGSAGDRELSQRILDDIQAPAINLCGDTTLRQTAALLARCRLGVGAESGIAHMACAVATPHVVVLGGGHFGRFMPYSPYTTVACLPLACYGCNWQCRYSSEHCVKDVAPEVVRQSIKRALGRGASKATVFFQGSSLWDPGESGPAWRSFDEFVRVADIEIVPVGDVPPQAHSRLLAGMAGREGAMPIIQAMDCNQEGERLFQAGDKAAAFAAFTKAIDLCPDLAAPYNNLAVLAWENGDAASAVQFLRQALEIDPAERATVLNGATILKSLGLTEEARSLCAAYAAGHPTDTDVARLLGGATAPGADAAGRYAVSVIVSTYNAQRFIRGCLEDLEAQTIADKMEIIVIDSGSQQGEGAVVREFQQRYCNIKYIRTEKRESVYAAWNRAIRVARGKYITNANTDDRHRRDALERMVGELEARPDVSLVYGDVAVTHRENDDPANPELTGHFRWPDFDPRLLFRVCYIGPQPMWRRELHDRYGYFDETYRSAGDYEFWLRIAVHEKFMHIPEVLGLYLSHAGSIEHRDAKLAMDESERAREAHWPLSWGKRPEPLPGYYVPVAAKPAGDNKAHQGAISNAQPLVSIAIPTHNRPGLLRDALASLVAQDYGNWEAIVVNDGGRSVEALALSADPAGRVRYVEHRQSFGPAAARNTALRLARGEIVCYLDDDDRFLPHHLSTVVKALKEGDAAFVFTESEVIAEKLEDGKRVVTGRSRLYHVDAYSRERLLVTNYIPINTWAHRWDCLEKAGFFDEALPSHEDWDFLLKLSRHYEFHFVPTITVEVRQRSGSNDSVTQRATSGSVNVFKQIYARTEDLANDEIRKHRSEVLAKLQQCLNAMPGGTLVSVAANGAGMPVVSEAERYNEWLVKHGLREIDAQLHAERMMLRWTVRPVVHFLVKTRRHAQAWLADTLDSLSSQLYPDWRLSVIADFAPPEDMPSDERLRWYRAPEGASFSEDIADAVSSVNADWVTVIEAGDRFEPHLLLACADYINVRPQWNLIYTDEDIVDAEGKQSDPEFKPDFNLDLLRSMPYVGGFCLVRRDVLRQAGGYTSLDGVENYDATLKVLDSTGERSIGHIAAVLYHRRRENKMNRNIKPLEEHGKTVLVRHIERNNISGAVADGLIPGTFRVLYQHPSKPLVSIIIPTRDKLHLFRPCVESLFEKTAYPNFEILVVDNDSEAEDTFDYYNDLEAAYPGRVRLLSYPHAFNYSAMNNLAAKEARGEYLLLLNNDTVVIQPDWLERMLAHAQRPEVGIVGPRLVYGGDGKIQHAGVVLGMNEIAGHVFADAPMRNPGYLARAQVDQNYSAVTGACLLIRKSVYQEVGGLDEERLKVSYNDVDLCLKVGARGYKIVWTPYATLIHHGSATQVDRLRSEEVARRFRGEQETMLDRWLPQLARDPAYNPNLSLASYQPVVEDRVDASWDVNFQDRPRVLAVPLNALGLGEHRVVAPLRSLERAGLAQIAFAPCSDWQVLPRIPTVVELERLRPDTLYLQSTVHDHHIERLKQYKRFNRVFKVFDFEDLKTNVPDKNSRKGIMFPEMKRRLREALSQCDRMTVTTEPLREAYRHLIDDIRVLPLRLERARWGHLKSKRRQGERARVGWAGAQQHHADLEVLIPVIKETAGEIDWIFFGMCLDELRPYVREVHEFVPFGRYPEKLASLNLDLAVAPLDYHPFNEAKTNLRLLEYGVMGWPVVCTDIYPYQNAPVKRVPNETAAWLAAIRERVHDLDAAEKEGDRLRQWVLDHWMLEDHVDEWLAALTPGKVARAEKPASSPTVIAGVKG